MMGTGRHQTIRLRVNRTVKQTLDQRAQCSLLTIADVPHGAE
jgi:hypothetical protein